MSPPTPPPDGGRPPSGGLVVAATGAEAAGLAALWTVAGPRGVRPDDQVWVLRELMAEDDPAAAAALTGAAVGGVVELRDLVASTPAQAERLAAGLMSRLRAAGVVRVVATLPRPHPGRDALAALGFAPPPWCVPASVGDGLVPGDLLVLEL